jgi:hypothetical protein
MTINAVLLGWLSKIVKFLASNSPASTVQKSVTCSFAGKLLHPATMS